MVPAAEENTCHIGDKLSASEAKPSGDTVVHAS
jgi:hypothetical protein